jgi:hypothetical protein
MEMDGEEIAGSFRVENGKMYSIKLESNNFELESVLIGKPFENWKEILQEMETIF